MNVPTRVSRARLGLCSTLVFLAALSGPLAAGVVSRFDYVFDFFVPLPDPAVWASSGNLSPHAVDGRGLQIGDFGDAHSLLYSHAVPEIGHGTNITTFSALVRTPSLSDGSALWSNHATGFRLILDDGSRRLVLALGRNPDDPGTPKSRVLLALGAPSVPPVPFPWDNGFHNVYEVGRLADGSFTFSATNNDPANTAPPVVVKIPAADLPASTGTAMVEWGMGAAGGGVSEWQETHGTVATSRVDLVVDTKSLEIEIDDDSEVEWKGLLTLPAGETFDPVAEGLVIKLAGPTEVYFEHTIPPGSFWDTAKGSYVLEKPGPPEVSIKIKPEGVNSYKFKIAIEEFSLSVSDRTVVIVTLTSGDKVGSQEIPLRDLGDTLIFGDD